MAEPRPSFFMLIAVTAVGPFALNVFVPSMPAVQREFGTGYGSVQLTLSVFLVGLAVAQLVFGPLSDRFGRRPTLLAGLLAFLAGTAVCALATGVVGLSIGRFVQGVGGCAGMTLARTMIRDLYEREQAASVMAYVIMAMVVAPMVAPTIGGLVETEFGWRANFLLTLGLAAIVTLGTWLAVPETHRGERLATTALDLMRVNLDLGRNRRFLGYALSNAFTVANFHSFLGGASYVMVALMGYTPTDYGLYFMSSAVAFMLGNLGAGKLSERLGIDRMITLGTSIGLAGGIAMAVVHFAVGLDPVTMFGCLAITSIGSGLSLPGGMSGAISVDPRRFGAASGLAGFLQMMMGAIFSFGVGMFLDKDATPMVLAMLVAVILAVAAHGVFCRGGRRP